MGDLDVIALTKGESGFVTWKGNGYEGERREGKEGGRYGGEGGEKGAR